MPEPVAFGGTILSRIRPERQTLVSGPGVLSHPGPPQIGWPEIGPEGPVALRLRRDRVLLVDGPVMAEGWDAATGCAVTDMGSGLAVLQIKGPAAFDIVGRGAELSLDTPSRSVARLVFGLEVALYRHGQADRIRLHVDRSLTGTLWAALQDAASV
ncbi:hypothetical protein [Jannaschia seohaensis]|uniref:hypothetical protein n=1 Tax=Jannaschia seohaensis TaxID=475081 RepID=UPI000D6BC078|nr:hypothetical protein [Jannaschia seohaensis]